jgi:TRAP transporter TAXI family solute receptor
VPLLLLVGSPAPAQALSDSFVSIGTGSSSGVYYPIGRGLCRIVNRERELHGLRCSVEATAGSVYNARMLEADQLEFAILQGDVLFEAYNGIGAWADRPMTELRSIMPLHVEIATLVVDSQIKVANPAELLEMTVNGGHPGSGSRSSFDMLLHALGSDGPTGAGRILELRSSALEDALCNGRLVAFLEVVGHPSALIRSIRQRCGAQLLPLDGPVVQAVVAERPYLQMYDIPGALYGLPSDVRSFGSHAALVTRADVADDVVYVMTMELLANLEEVRALHPTLAELDPAALADAMLAAPLHPGAERAYRELGLLP